MKVIIVLVLRIISIKPVYDELDREYAGGGVRTAYGQRGCQIRCAQRSDDIPFRTNRMISYAIGIGKRDP